MGSGDKNKITGIFTNRYFVISFITLGALFVRLLNIDKPFGLWYDEMLTYVVSSDSFPLGILKECWRMDFHMPLYYMYVHVWMKLFGAADLTLRLSSVFWGVLSVTVFFYLGKTYKSKSLGYFLAVVSCLSPIMIYYSQEVRFYSMLMFFSAVSVIFFLKILDNPSRKNFVFFFLANLVILYIFTMGIIFVGLEVLILLIHFYLYKKDYFANLLKYLIVFTLFSVPYFFLLFNYLYFSNQVFLDPFSYYPPNSFNSLLTLINDWFSPGLSGFDVNLYRQFLQTPATIIVLITMTISSACFLSGFVSAFRKIDKKFIYLAAIVALFLAAEVFLSVSGTFVLLTKYTLVILPIILLISCDGLLLIKSKNIKTFLIGIILLTFTWNCINYKHVTTFSLRRNGLKTATTELAKFKPGKNDYILFSNGPYLLKKYIPNANFIDFDVPSILYLDKTKREALKVFDKNFVLTTNKHNSQDKLLKYFLGNESTKELKSSEESFVAKIPKGGKLIIVGAWGASSEFESMRKVVSNYNNNKSVENKKLYKQTIFYYAYSKIYGDLQSLIDSDKSLKKVNTITIHNANYGKKSWKILVYEKL